MQIPLTVTFRDIKASDKIREACDKEAKKLERFHDRITSCRVVVAFPVKNHHHKGGLFSVRVDLAVPGREILVNRDHSEKHSHEDVFVAVRDSFKVARRQLEQFKDKRRGEVKTHEEPTVGKIAKVDAEGGFGFIESPDGRELYFHENSLLDETIESIKVGTDVRFVEEQGDDGPQASSVRLV